MKSGHSIYVIITVALRFVVLSCGSGQVNSGGFNEALCAYVDIGLAANTDTGEDEDGNEVECHLLGTFNFWPFGFCCGIVEIVVNAICEYWLVLITIDNRASGCYQLAPYQIE